MHSKPIKQYSVLQYKYSSVEAVITCYRRCTYYFTLQYMSVPQYLYSIVLGVLVLDSFSVCIRRKRLHSMGMCALFRVQSTMVQYCTTSSAYNYLVPVVQS